MRVIVVGGGAAGLTSAYFAAKHGARVTVLERTKEAGKKILMSGGTRCNVLPVRVKESSDYFTDSGVPLMLRVFKSWNLHDCHNWLAKDIGIDMVEERETNKWFPASNNAKQVRDQLVLKCRQVGVDFEYDSAIHKISRVEDGQWQCTDAAQKNYTCDRVIVSTGGLSYPAVGTDGLGHEILQQQLQHSLVSTYPALTPLLGKHPGTHNLAGISLDVELSISLAQQQRQQQQQQQQHQHQHQQQQQQQQQPEPKQKQKRQQHSAQRQGFLFTHRGFSGPSVLDISHFFVKYIESKGRDSSDSVAAPEISVNWTNQSRDHWDQYFREASTNAGKGLVVNKVKQFLPERLAISLCEELQLTETNIANMSAQKRKQLAEHLSSFKLNVTGHAGYKLAEVTGGGVPLTEINTATMESKVQQGVYVCGEIVDVFGRIGGFNFYWAWVSGRLAGISAATLPQQ